MAKTDFFKDINMRTDDHAIGGKTRGARIRIALIGCLAIGFAGISDRPAAACSILPPPAPPMLTPLPGEAESEYRARAALHVDGFFALQRQRAQDAILKEQNETWERASQVALVEIVRIETDLPIANMPMGRGARVDVKPVGWIKGGADLRGQQRRAPFTLAHTSFTSCGPSPAWPVFTGKTGDRFVVFLKQGAPSQTAVLDVLPPSEIVYGDLATALAAQVRLAK